VHAGYSRGSADIDVSCRGRVSRKFDLFDIAIFTNENNDRLLALGAALGRR
jgi:hypothetical protein